MRINHARNLSIVLFALLFFYTVPCLAASFVAEVIQTRRGKSHSGKFYLKDHRYRMDMVEEGKALSILVDRKSGKTAMLIPSDKVYLEFANSDMKSLMNNPFETHLYMVKNYKARSVGQETVQSLACEKQVISAQGKDVMTVWIAKKYGFPIKLVNIMNGRTAELKTIKAKSMGDNLFIVPAGFQLVKRVPLAPPNWARAIPAAPLLDAPFKKDLSAKQIIRIKPVKGSFIKMKITNLEDQPCRFTAVAFKNGKPLKDPSFSTFNLTRKRQAVTKTSKENPGDADEIVVRVAKGRVNINAKLEEAPPEGITLKKSRLKANHGEEIDINYRKASHLILQDDPVDGKASQGILTVFGTVVQDAGNGTIIYQKNKLETISFRLANGESKMWPFSRDKKIGVIGIDVSKGAVDVRIEQPKKSGSTPPSWTSTPPGKPTKVSAKQINATKSTYPDTIIILDASGSMWGQINGKPKMQIAKEVMNDLIGKLPPDMHVGLMAYGHRRKGDCNDIEMLTPVGRLNPSQMKAKVKAIKPKGKTPLSAAIKQAAEKLHYTAKRAAVVLVSDGLETCGGNPCDLAEKLAMTGVDFTVHVIGFDLSKEEQLRLRCLADKTGGMFLAAGNADALRKALFTTIKKVQAPPPPVKEEPGKATLEGPATVPAGAQFKVAWKGPDSRRDYVSIAKKGSKDLNHVDYVYTERGNPVRMTAPGDPGLYELRYVHSHSRQVIGRTDIKVTPVTAKVEAPPSANVATKIEVSWKGPAYKSDYISIARPNQGPGSYVTYTYVSRGNPLKVQVPSDPGTYEIRYIMGRGDKLLAKATLTAKAVTAQVHAPDSANVASKIQVSWKGPANKTDYISIARPDQKPGSYVTYTYVSRGNPLKVQVPSEPGTYEVRYILGRGSKLLAKTTFNAKAVTAQVHAPDSANVASKIEVNWAGPANKSDYISIARPDQKPGSYVTYTYVSRGNPLKVQVPSDPGTYEIRYIMGRGDKLLAKATFAAKPVTAQVQAPDSADMGSQVPVSWEGPANKDDYVCISRPDQKAGGYVTYTYVSRGNPLKVQVPPDPGTYEVRYIMGRGNKLLARTTLKVKSVTAELQAPDSAGAASKVQVDWKGPAYKTDYICISRPDQKPGRYVKYTYVGRGNPLTVKTPSKPGAYEVRYILGRGDKLLAKRAITIK